MQANTSEPTLPLRGIEVCSDSSQPGAVLCMASKDRDGYTCSKDGESRGAALGDSDGRGAVTRRQGKDHLHFQILNVGLASPSGKSQPRSADIILNTNDKEYGIAKA